MSLVINIKYKIILKLLVNDLKHCNEDECMSSMVVFSDVRKILNHNIGYESYPVSWYGCNFWELESS